MASSGETLFSCVFLGYCFVKSASNFTSAFLSKMDGTVIRSIKRVLRSAVTSRVGALSASQELVLSTTVAQNVLSALWFQSAGSVSVYLSMPTGEVQTRPILAACLNPRFCDRKLSKQVYVPVVCGKLSDDMRMLHVRGQAAGSSSAEDPFVDFPRSKWGIPEPPTEYPMDDSASRGGAAAMSAASRMRSDLLEDARSGRLPLPLVVLVPGVAFSPQGHRLGHGKGYYDCFIRKLRAALAEGAAKRSSAGGTVSDSEAVACGACAVPDGDPSRSPLDRPLLLVGLAFDEQMAPAPDAVDDSALAAEGAGATAASAAAPAPRSGSGGGAASASGAAPDGLPLPPLPAIPVEPHDELMDLVVTPTRVIECWRGRG